MVKLNQFRDHFKIIFFQSAVGFGINFLFITWF